MVALSMPANGPLSDPFGPRTNVPGSPFHHGQDIGFYTATRDFRVFAAAPGVVSKIYWDSALGNCIDVTHTDGTVTQYCHLSAAVVLVEAAVVRRQQIGVMGATGTAAVVHGIPQTHLHFVYWVGGVRVDPMPYMTGTASGDVTPIVERRNNEMSKLYYQQDTSPTLYALAGDSPGTPANWLETTDQTLANGWSAQIGGPSVGLSAGTWDNYKGLYLSALKISGGIGGGGTFTSEDRARLQAVPTAEQNGAAARAQIVK